jgi:hypothetical protein
MSRLVNSERLVSYNYQYTKSAQNQLVLEYNGEKITRNKTQFRHVPLTGWL